ncbi:MAG: hypothetical protein HZA22_02605 [Nitrospirae bacterium]|nr:hypothetical protein [Nitrospirota bacterium]
MLKLTLLIVFIVPLVSINVALSATGEWTTESISLVGDNYPRHMVIVSPNGKNVVVVDGVYIKVMCNGKDIPGVEDVGVISLAELGWSPDSNAFFINESEGGSVGEWVVTVYVLENGKVKVIHNIGKNAVGLFKKHVRKCDEVYDYSNIGAVNWIDGSRQLLLIAEVPNHSTCPDMGKIMGMLSGCQVAR